MKIPAFRSAYILGDFSTDLLLIRRFKSGLIERMSTVMLREPGAPFIGQRQIDDASAALRRERLWVNARVRGRCRSAR